MRKSGWYRFLLAAGLAAAVAGCTALPPTSPSPQPPASDETIVFGLPLPPFAPPPFFRISNAQLLGMSVHPQLAARLVYSSLYRYDDSLTPVPDLAAEPCDVTDDGLTITCQLVDATFHDGTALTADDVAFTYELGRRALGFSATGTGCLFATFYCFGEVLESAEGLDERTVQFRLTRPDATFETLVMPAVLIDSRAVVEAAYAPLAERATTLDASAFEAAAEAISGQQGASQPECARASTRAVELLGEAGLRPPPREHFNRADGTIDECLYGLFVYDLVAGVGASLRETGLEAIALAYPALSFNQAPVGTGPFRFAGLRDGPRARLEAYAGYHRGPPAAPAIEIAVTRDLEAAPQAMLDGELHVLPIPGFFPFMLEALDDNPDLRFVRYPEPAYFMLAYNLRDGRLFADLNLRAALELCIDKPATVDAAAEGTGEPIYSFVAPISWAYDQDLPRPSRDVDEARSLIEASGWSEGEDGIYVRDGVRLATEVFVADFDTQRVTFMELVAEQARDCGFDLTIVPADPETVLAPLGEYPHIPGGRDEPFDAHFLGWIQGYDPHEWLFHSSRVTSEDRPVGENFMGFRSERVDELLDAGLATYDTRERARIYRDLQEMIAAEKPVLFGWAARAYDAIDERLGYVDGELNLSSPQWFWQYEKLVLREE